MDEEPSGAAVHAGTRHTQETELSEPSHTRRFDKHNFKMANNQSSMLAKSQRQAFLPRGTSHSQPGSVKHSPLVRGGKDPLRGFDDPMFQTARNSTALPDLKSTEGLITPMVRTNRTSLVGELSTQKDGEGLGSNMPTGTNLREGLKSVSQLGRKDAGYKTFTELLHAQPTSRRTHHAKTSSMHSAGTLDIQEFYLSRTGSHLNGKSRKHTAAKELFGRRMMAGAELSVPEPGTQLNPLHTLDENSFPKYLGARFQPEPSASYRGFRSKGDIVEESYRNFGQNHARDVENSILLEFPTDIREYLDSQSAKIRLKTKSLLVDFERSLFAFAKVCESVQLYKPELGASCLQVMADCRHHWKEAVIYLCRQCVQVQDFEKDARQKVLAIQIEEQKKVTSMELKVKSLETMLAYRDSEIDRLKTSIQVKQSEINGLYESKKIFQQIIRHNDPDEAANERMESLEKLSALQDRITQLSKEYKKIEEERLTQMKNIDLLKELTNRNFFTHHKDAEVQVDEYELQWGLKSLKRETAMNPEFSHLNDRISSLVAHPLSTFEDPLKYVASSSQTKSEVGSVLGSPLRDSVREHGSQVNFGSVTTFDQLQTGSGLNSPSDRKGSVLKKKTSPYKSRTVGAKGPGGTSGAFTQTIVWQLPFGVCRFLEDIYGHYTDVSVVVWHIFKNEIFQLLEARLSDDWEVIGSPTNAVIPFEEYIILYFTRKTPQLRLAALKLMEFLASLKFYAQKWKRAYLCALVCNLMRRKDSGIYDYYLQNYVLFLYSRVNLLRDHLVETDDGYTFVPFEKIHDTLSIALEFMETDRAIREISGIEMRGRSLDGKDGLVDLDDVLYQCVSFFLEENTRRTDYLKKSFRSHYQKRGKDITFIDFDRIITENGWFTLATSLKHLTFAGELTRARAYNLFCNLYSDKKRHIDECFEICIKRYGLSIPFPLFIADVISKMQADKKSNNLLSGSVGSLSKPSVQPSSPKTIGKSTSKTLVGRPGGAPGKRVQMIGSEDDDKKDKGTSSLQDLKPEGRARLGSINLAPGVGSPAGLQLSSTGTLTTPGQNKPLSLIPMEPSSIANAAPGKAGGRLDPYVDIEEKVALSSSLIAQHFSILRELHQYCMLVKSNVGPDSSCMNLEEIWRNFNHLVEILEAGCDFLHYPIKLA